MAPPRPGLPGAVRLLAYLLRESRRLLALYLLAGIITGFSNIGLLALMNAVLARETDQFTLLWIFIGVCLLLATARTCSELLLTHVGEGTIFSMRVQLTKRVLEVPLRRLEEIGPHRVLSTLADDILTLSNIMRLLPVLTLNTAIVAGAIAYFGWLSWKAFAFMVVLMALGIASYQLPVMRAFESVQRARELNDKLYQHFRGLTEGAKEFRLNRRRREIFLSHEFVTTAEGVRAQNIYGARILIFAASWGQLLIFAVIGLMLFALPLITRAESAVLTGYTLTLLYLMTPLQTLMDAMPALNRANVALWRIEQLGLQLEPRDAQAGAGTPTHFDPQWQRLDLVGLTHAFKREDQEGSFVLGPVDLCLRPGEVVFISGGNGSGKTTLGKLLAGLYVPDRGEIRLDGKVINDQNRDAFRQLFSAVFFDFFLFPTLLGPEREEDLDSKASSLLEWLQLARKVRVENGKLSNTELSQGQRKRLALLAAIMEDRPIYLFDEWAADQDPRFKEIFYQEVLPGLKAVGKTALVITHDDRYFYLADRVIKIEDGKIAADVTQHFDPMLNANVGG